MAREIHVTVKPDGTVEIEGKGFAGAECINATKFLEEALGIVKSDTRTKEFYVPQKQQQQQRTR